MKKLLAILLSLMLFSSCERQKISSPQNYLHIIDLNKINAEYKPQIELYTFLKRIVHKNNNCKIR